MLDRRTRTTPGRTLFRGGSGQEAGRDHGPACKDGPQGLNHGRMFVTFGVTDGQILRSTVLEISAMIEDISRKTWGEKFPVAG